MSPVLLALTHVLAFAFGALASYVVVMRAGGHTVGMPHVSRRVHEEREPHMRKRRSDRFVVALIVASIVVIGIGFQAKTARDRQAVQAACLNAFASQLADVVLIRTTVSNALDDARRVHSDALDDVLITVWKAREDPPRATVDDFDHALRRYVRASAKLDTIEKRAQRTRASNPYPEPPREVCPND